VPSFTSISVFTSPNSLNVHFAISRPESTAFSFVLIMPNELCFSGIIFSEVKSALPISSAKACFIIGRTFSFFNLSTDNPPDFVP